VTFAEGFLSAKASTRGKGPSPRGSPLSAKALNPVVKLRNVGYWFYAKYPCMVFNNVVFLQVNYIMCLCDQVVNTETCMRAVDHCIKKKRYPK
jgi:hypothetical protein